VDDGDSADDALGPVELGEPAVWLVSVGPVDVLDEHPASRNADTVAMASNGLRMTVSPTTSFTT
jgi:hypothetical protein